MSTIITPASPLVSYPEYMQPSWVLGDGRIIYRSHAVRNPKDGLVLTMYFGRSLISPLRVGLWIGEDDDGNAIRHASVSYQDKHAVTRNDVEALASCPFFSDRGRIDVYPALHDRSLIHILQHVEADA